MAANDALQYKFAYNANGQVAHVEYEALKHVTETEYDLSNRPCRIKTHKVVKDTTGNVTSQEHIYTGEVAYENVCGRLSEFREKVGSGYTAYKTTIGYDEENRPTALGYGSHGESLLEYDGLGRIAKATVKAGNGAANTTIYTYVNGATLEQYADLPADVVQNSERWKAAVNADGMQSTTGLVASIQQTGGNFTYTYDDIGNISSVVQDGVTTSYTYDALGQLIRVVDGQEGAIWEYTYDQGGNILSKKKFVDGEETESMDFEYTNENWRDQLTKVNDKTISYDEIGNPLNDGTWTYTWQNGRQLESMSKSGTYAKFVYNENGLRVQKIIQPSKTDTTNAVVTNYTLHGKNIVHMTQGSNELHFFYDAQNKPAVVVYNGTPYSYVKNLQGDIVAILDSDGAVVVQYKYDAWGRPISCTYSDAHEHSESLGKLNPFRYRGYVYDEETGLYYLRSRYYAPNRCRFMSVDKIIAPGIHEANLFTYCKNIPSMAKDPDGYLGILGTLSAIAAGVSIAYAREIISATADSFLSERGWTLTNMLFQQGLWGSGSPVTDETYGIQQVKDLIAADSQTYEMIEKVLGGMEPGTTIEYEPDDGFEYTKGDMYYALQHVDFKANITKHSDGSWNASIRITDTYNFDNIRWGISLGDVANNGGLFLQSIGMMKPYEIDITVELSSK